MSIKISLAETSSMKPFRPVWWPSAKIEWAPILLQENKKYWGAQTTADGRPWDPIITFEDIRKDQTGITDRIAKDTAEVFRTAVVRPWGNKFIVETTPWGIILQKGTKKINPRPWMGVPDSSLQALTDIAWKHILK